MYYLEQLRALVRRYLERRSPDPRIQHTFIVQSINRVGGMLGIDIFTPGYSSTNLLLRMVLLNTFTFFWINLYSLTTTYGNLVDFMYSFETLLYVGIACIKMYVFIKNKTLILQMHQYMIDFFDHFHGDREQDELLVRTLNNTTLLSSLFAVCSSSAPGLLFVGSLLWSIAVEYVLPFGFFIPTVGMDTLQGYTLNYGFQMLETTLMVIGIISSESAFFMFQQNACLQVDMLRLQLRRLSELSAANGDGSSTKEIRTRIQTIIQHHVEHLDYSKSMCSLFELHFFIVFGCIFFQLVSNVVVIVSVPDWYPGYFLFIMLTVQLFFSCALGETFNIKSDELTVAIYNVPWYNMEVRDQKAMRLLLMASQNPGRLSYGFGTVNMRAFFEIFRKTYSIAMMMISVNEEE
ncbi:odorant receptor 43a-like [Anopheles arabiensis]|uniref:odorant receptor 43a-like n=1 Tax=Anopheles arabiensis TaxID=7173 RepID=UPI001AACA19C|nr:odorant receptor 43a-like [Anopheles arabiensis]